ncbi:AAA family ATPase [Rossellomorea marisflavi]|uniref:AAA family ATPase n=1 Tax=Rossellomorea marisflavi TaxID=189381 RepID=A0A5D4RYK4_9BACI|nr:ATP-dependent RecD-like DNA helicase [Rossellomorea marisflavi]TYS56417.1 AAA family ATPase [Rossellomorea marisflavi]
MEAEQIEIKVLVKKELFYNEADLFGVYSLQPQSNEELIYSYVEKNVYNNFVVSGDVPKLAENKEYDIIIEPSETKKYGKGFSFVAVKGNKPVTVEEQQSYIRAMLAERKAEAIITAYPNHKVLDMMKDNTFDVKKVYGIAEKSYKDIKNTLMSNLDIQEAIVELRKFGVKFKSMKRLIEYFGSASAVVRMIEDNIYNLTIADGFGFKKVDAYALERGDSKTNMNRIQAAIKYILENDSASGHSWMTVDSLENEMFELLKISSNYIEKGIQLAKEDRKLTFIDRKVALVKNYNLEKNVLERLNKLMSSNVKTSKVNPTQAIHHLEKEMGVTYTLEQKEAIQKAIENNVLILNGKGGTGKSFTVKAILRSLEKYSYCCCALSGKASKILADHGLVSMTIHRMLGWDMDGFAFNKEKPLPYDIIVLDEASMVNSYLFNAVLNAMRDDAKLIIVGDSGQLSPIGNANIFYDLLKSETFPQQELTIVQRQAQKSGILSTANMIREGKQVNGRYNYKNQVLGELKDMVLIPVQNKETLFDLVMDICEKYKGKNYLDFQVITGLKDRGDISVQKLNLSLQKIFNPHYETSEVIKIGKYDFRLGDKIIQNGNNYEAGEKGDISVFNGTLGVIKELTIDTSDKKNHRILIDFDGLGDVLYTKDDLVKTELAYAITCHRSQGSTIPHVLFVFDYASYMLLSKEFIYTGITRSSKGCVMLCENAALHHAIQTSHSDKRRTFLYDMIRGEV